jgi:hypothetical protein
LARGLGSRCSWAAQVNPVSNTSNQLTSAAFIDCPVLAIAPCIASISAVHGSHKRTSDFNGIPEDCQWFLTGAATLPGIGDVRPNTTR